MALIVSKKYVIFIFAHAKAYLTKFDLGLNRSRPTQGHNLNNLGSTRIHNATNQVSRSSVLEKKIFKFFTIYGHGGHLGHVTLTI